MAIHNRKFFGVLSILLAFTLVLAACGGGQEETPAAQGGEGAATPTLVAGAEGTEAADAADDTAEVTGTLESAVTTALTETAATGDDDEAAEEVEVITGTQLITGTEVTTDVIVSTDTVVVEQQLITTVVTSTDLITNATVLTDEEVTTDSELITDTSEISETAGGAAAGATTGGAGAAGSIATGGTAVGLAGTENRLMRATTLLDYDFQNADGEINGQVNDLLIDASTGEVLYAMLQYGGFLGLGDTQLPVPLSAFTLGENNEFVVNFQEEELQNFPDVSGDWPDGNDPTWDDDVVNFWNNIGVNPGTERSEASANVMRASELINNYGVGDIGYGDGTVQDMLVSLAESRIRYVLVSFPDGELFNEEWAAIPFSAFDAAGLAEGQLRLVQGFDPTVLEQAPRFNTGDVGDTGLFDTGFGADWDTYWGDAGYADRAD